MVPNLRSSQILLSEEDLISNSDLEVHFNQRAETPSNTVSLITANGPVEADTKHEVHIEALGNPLQLVQLPNTPAVCSVGKKCMKYLPARARRASSSGTRST